MDAITCKYVCNGADFRLSIMPSMPFVKRDEEHIDLNRVLNPGTRLLDSIKNIDAVQSVRWAKTRELEVRIDFDDPQFDDIIGQIALVFFKAVREIMDPVRFDPILSLRDESIKQPSLLESLIDRSAIESPMDRDRRLADAFYRECDRGLLPREQPLRNESYELPPPLYKENSEPGRGKYGSLD